MMIILTFVVFAIAVVAARREYFTAAVFETAYFHNSSATTKEEIVPANLAAYNRAATAAASKGADIIVFPEYGLFPNSNNRTLLTPFTEHVPDPEKQKTNPCDESEKYRDRLILKTLSCMAKRNRMYVVADMGDRQPCPEAERENCPENGKRIYNTIVAFDKKGYLVARYHKNHVYFEVMNTPKPFDMITFDTDFGRMGLIVCFDSVFKESVELVKKQGVDTMLFPTYWFDIILPFNAIEWQQAWGFANGVNFIAANVHRPHTGSLGSGIYSKKDGFLVYTYNPDRKSRVLVARVPLGRTLLKQNVSYRFVIDKDGAHEEKGEDGGAFPAYCKSEDNYTAELQSQEEDFIYRCFKDQYAKYTLVKLDDLKGNASACLNGTCCSVTYSANSMDENYYLAVFNGTNDVRSFYHWAEEDCAVVRCDADEDGRPCGAAPSTAKTVFNFLEIRVTFSDTALVYPTVSKTNFRLAPKSEYDVRMEGTQTVLTFQSNSDAPLLKAGMIARIYERDPPYVPYYKYF